MIPIDAKKSLSTGKLVVKQAEVDELTQQLGMILGPIGFLAFPAVYIFGIGDGLNSLMDWLILFMCAVFALALSGYIIIGLRNRFRFMHYAGINEAANRKLVQAAAQSLKWELVETAPEYILVQRPGFSPRYHFQLSVLIDGNNLKLNMLQLGMASQLRSTAWIPCIRGTRLFIAEMNKLRASGTLEAGQQ